jgi:Sulfotransferase domain
MRGPRWLRRLRVGAPIIVVSGLPRSGTSMMMQMLAAGGVPVMSDGRREPDESNPAGYFELEAVKALDQPGDRRWLNDARGRAVKIVSALLEHLPESFDYKVIFMERPLAEVLASQDAMLARSGPQTDTDRHRQGGFDAPPPDAGSRAALVAEYERHLRRVHGLIARRACFDMLAVRYTDTIADPRRVAEQVARFLGAPLDVDAMTAAVDPRLHRQRRG